MHTNSIKKFNLDSPNYAVSFGLRHRKTSHGVDFFSEQAAVNSVAKNLGVLRGTDRSHTVGDGDGRIWTIYRHGEDQKIKKVDPALAKIYLETFHGLRGSRLKHHVEGDEQAKKAEKRLDVSVEAKQSTLFKVAQNHDTQNFVPSPELVSYWLDGINSVRAEAAQSLIYIENAADFEYYSSELVRSLDTVISNFAKLKAYDGGRYHMTFGGKILSTIETLIVDELLIPPSFSSNFLMELHKLLVSQSQLRPRFSGRWGRLILDDRRELVFDLGRRARRTLAQVLKG